MAIVNSFQNGNTNIAHVFLEDLHVDNQGFAIHQDEQHPAVPVLTRIPPLVVCTTVHAAVARQHPLDVAAVEYEVELALDEDAVVQRHGAVHGRLDARGEVDQAGATAVGDVDMWLVDTGFTRFVELLLGSCSGTYLVLTGEFDVDIVVHVDLIAHGGVYDVGDAVSVAQGAVVVSIIVADEDTQSFFVVARHEAARVAQTITGEFGDRSSVFARHVVVTELKFLDKRDMEKLYILYRKMFAYFYISSSGQTKKKREIVKHDISGLQLQRRPESRVSTLIHDRPRSHPRRKYPDILKDAPELESVGCPLSKGKAQITIAYGTEEVGDLNEFKDDNIIVVDGSRNPLGDAVIRKPSGLFDRTPTRLNLGEVTEGSIPSSSMVFCLAQCQVPLMSTISDEDMAGVKSITNNAKCIVWVTGGNLIEGSRPEFALISGIARALVLEQPSVRFHTYDLDNIYTNVEETADNLIKVLIQSNSAPDKEFVQRQGVVHVSRYVPDDNLNSCFRQQRGDELVELLLGDVKPAKLSFKKPGQFSSIYFNQIELPGTLDPHDVQVQVKAIGLNARDYAVFAGKVDSPNCACSPQYSGVMARVGVAVSTLKASDRVIAMAPSQLRTTQIVLAFPTAIYALHDRARMQNGESVLIHSAASAVGSAAIQISKLAGAGIFTTVSSAGKREYLIKAFGRKPSSILSSQDATFLPAIFDLTNGKGVDVTFCGGRLEMDQFLRNVTFTAFDLTNLYDTTNPAHKPNGPLF
ncbi:hypothetical protein EPUS_07599 [Endocarpon pusillum Z07020]|uniref:Enoyl reductase (ER) domain-containing protein n=1 Tax=Endocarpon pusillum (strain Z07020 / HMAS-L-300199) TaxID=1263415 RepID=U1HMT0_ENDPU|nr:uncharacterized protein EPUS_07599 [Endocarpon pusillum Z07020]ERF70334.1 hypothetical protein EPUS_07599 [Endocarpon pusillum Z07020]